ncbi:MAG: methyltransferase domain-containing protein [Burkholderiaceae bacterium]|nr:methyltransferase domain-containing protein [Burkholderiaceae bacterium]
MDARLQTRIQRYGWDLAADDYEPLWGAQRAGVQGALLAAAALAPGEQVLDLACGSGHVTLQAADSVGAQGHVLGVDLSQRMVDTASRRARAQPTAPVAFARMDAQQLALPDAQFDVVLCSLGLMYLPDPAQAVREMRRVLRPGGRLVLSVWGERSRCGWAALFEIVDAEVASEVCPLFFGLGRQDALASLCGEAGLAQVVQQRRADTLDYASGDLACRAAFIGGPVALAWSRFSQEARHRVCARYLDSLAAWRAGAAYRVPAEFVIVTASGGSGTSGASGAPGA